jgi:hypothetical protein
VRYSSPTLIILQVVLAHYFIAPQDLLWVTCNPTILFLHLLLEALL